jgi:hypothetical protein
MKSTIFWDVTMCCPLKVNQYFVGTYRLHLQGKRVSQAKNQLHNIPEDKTLQSIICLMRGMCPAHILLRIEDGGSMFLRNADTHIPGYTVS